DIDRAKVIERQSMLAHQPTQSTSERETGNACRRNHAAGYSETMQLRLAVDLTPGDATLRPHSPTLLVDVDAFHRRQIDHYAAINCRSSRNVVTAPADRSHEA